MLISEKGTLEMWNAKYVCSCGFTNYLLSIQVKTILFLNYEYKFTTQLQLPSNNNHIIIRILNQHKNTWYTVFHGQHKKICLNWLPILSQVKKIFFQKIHLNIFPPTTNNFIVGFLKYFLNSPVVHKEKPLSMFAFKAYFFPGVG